MKCQCLLLAFNICLCLSMWVSVCVYECALKVTFRSNWRPCRWIQSFFQSFSSVFFFSKLQYFISHSFNIKYWTLNEDRLDTVDERWSAQVQLSYTSSRRETSQILAVFVAVMVCAQNIISVPLLHRITLQLLIINSKTQSARGGLASLRDLLTLLLGR